MEEAETWVETPMDVANARVAAAMAAAMAVAHEVGRAGVGAATGAAERLGSEVGKKNASRRVPSERVCEERQA